MLDRLAVELFGSERPEEILYTELTRELTMDDGVGVLRLAVPFAERSDIDLKKVGDELIVTVGGEKRTIILPSALSGARPSGAALENGTLKVSFEDVRASRRAQPERV